MKIFLISPVRNITPPQRVAIRKYVRELEKLGHKVHWPLRDTFQKDVSGFRPCSENRAAIKKADEVHVWWDRNSKGSVFDLGMSFALSKKIVLVEGQMGSNIHITYPEKSFDNLLFYIARKSRARRVAR